MTIPLSRELTADGTYHPFGGLSTFRRLCPSETVDRRAVLLLLVLSAGAAGSAIGLVNSGYQIPHLWAVIVLGVIAAAAERQSIAFTETTQVSVSFLPLVFVAVAFGPLAAFVAGAISQLGDIRRPLLRPLTYVPIRAMTGTAAGLATAPVWGYNAGFAGYLVASLVGSLSNLLVDLAFNGLILRVRRGHSIRVVARATAPLFVVALPLYVPLIALFLYGYRAFSVTVVMAFCVPALALQRLIQLYQEQRQGVRNLRLANERLARANLSFATALVTTLDARDRYTAGHSAAVAIYARDIAERMGLSEEERAQAHLAGLVHDVGKVGLPAGLLEKNGSLNLAERRRMEEHSEIGERILGKVEDYAEIARIVRHHHERVDGCGYPDRLCGDAIPLISRILAVADAYNAMTSDRPYREALPSRVARIRIAQAVGTQFDTTVVAAFEAIMATATEPYKTGSRADFVFDAERDVALPNVA